ncbi:unnamed protein product, partial [Rotaria sp. Silwood2]
LKTSEAATGETQQKLPLFLCAFECFSDHP